MTVKQDLMRTFHMTILLLLAVSVSVVATTTSCAAEQVYVAVTKKCTTMAEEESYQILRENTVVITSSPFAENEQRTDEYCLPSSAHTQYVLKLKDSARNSWMAGAWISVAGLYGNIVFKNYMTEDVEESFPLSLYYAISKQQQWKMFVTFSEIDATWNALAFDDSTWQTVVPATITAQQTGTQYYRKQFSGVEDMAAYEIQVNYRYGVIIHLNGKEVFRDQMPFTGAVRPSTASVGGYDVYAFRGVIRPATEVLRAPTSWRWSCTSATPSRRTRWSSTRTWRRWPPRSPPRPRSASSTPTRCPSAPPRVRTLTPSSTLTRRAPTRRSPPTCPPW